jgi:hypothetical protein
MGTGLCVIDAKQVASFRAVLAHLHAHIRAQHIMFLGSVLKAREMGSCPKAESYQFA